MNIDKLTVFYSLSTNKPKIFCMGTQTLDYFGEDKNDYNYGVLVVPYEDAIIDNFNNLVVSNGALVPKK